ncbi:MAG: hypothetical protein KF864_05550 [Phycisphaeraceae bacterium]|nr:hypothetical protein [Phycisphaeraceae bacterium]
MHGRWMRLCGVVGAAALLLGAAAAAVASPPVAVNRAALKPFWDKARTGRVDVVALGDSNQFQLGHGWDAAWIRALHNRFGLYATSLLAVGEANGGGSSAGDRFNIFPQASSGQYDYSGAPEALHRYLNNPPSLLAPMNYLYLPEGRTVSSQVATGMVLAANCWLSVSEPLRFHYTYGLFPGVGAGSFQPAIRRDSSPFSILISSPPVSTRAGDGQEARIEHGHIDLPGEARDYPVALRFIPSGGTVVGPMIAYYQRAEGLARPTGASLSTIYGLGSQSARDMAAALQASTDETLTLYFSRIRALQDNPRRVLIRVNTGLNDRAEPLPSVGPAQVPNGTSAAAYEDNLRAIIERITQVWALNQWAEDELYFLLAPSHPVDNPDQARLLEYRERAEALAMAYPRTATVRLDRILNATQILARGWYPVGGFDRDHLREAAYVYFAEEEIRALLRPDCAADFNEDGGVDGQDIEAFYAMWQIGDDTADVNQDGGVDGQDVEAFFTLWEAGGC